MAAWVYSDWITYEESDPATARDRLRRHMQEVSDKITADIAAHSYSKQNHPYNTYYADLKDSLKSMRTGSVNGGRTIATFPSE